MTQLSSCNKGEGRKISNGVNVDEALKIILENINSLPFEEVKLLNSLDRVLASDVYSNTDIPPFDNFAGRNKAYRKGTKVTVKFLD